MALDYSKLSDEELKAIESGDYSKLSDATLQALSQETQAAAPVSTQPEPPAPTAGDYAELGALAAGIPVAGYGAYKYATKVSPVVKGAKMVYDAVRSPSGMLNPSNLAQAAEALKGRMPTPAPGPVAPAAPPAPPPAVSPILDAQGRPMVRPVAPTPTVPTMTAGEPPIRPPAQPSIMDRASQMVRQLAANRVVQGAARIGGTAAAALTPGNVGQNYPFPQAGPLRGSEINPATGRPWTQQELDAYRRQYGG